MKMKDKELINKESFEKAIEHNRVMHSTLAYHYRKPHEYSRLFIDGFDKNIRENLYEISKYVEQLEAQIKEYEELGSKQIVARTYSYDQRPVGLGCDTENLEKYLNKGCHIVMVNKVREGVIEYILERESK